MRYITVTLPHRATVTLLSHATRDFIARWRAAMTAEVGRREGKNATGKSRFCLADRSTAISFLSLAPPLPASALFCRVPVRVLD